MALIHLTTAMTEAEERATQNSNNSFLNTDKVSTSRKVNSKDLSADIVLTASDVGAATSAQGTEADNATSFINAMFRANYTGHPCPNNDVLNVDLSNPQSSVNMAVYYVDGTTPMTNCPSGVTYGIRFPVIYFGTNFVSVLVLGMYGTGQGHLFCNTYKDGAWSGWVNV